MAEIRSVKDVLEEGKYKLNIPPYQRPYKWSKKTVIELLEDMNNAILSNTHEMQNKGFKYRIGTVILHHEDDQYNIVDGQQRLITLSLIYRYLKPELHNSILDYDFKMMVSKIHIYENYKAIEEWFKGEEADFKNSFLDSLEHLFEFVIIDVEEISEAFQLFDSQNTRGKELDPHDLLKTYHLREMNEDIYRMKHAVTKWEAIKPEEIKMLFDIYLFPIYNWCKKHKDTSFDVEDIDVFKGVPSDLGYTYALRVIKSMPCFQLNEPFASGNDFFEMISYYNNLLHDIKEEIDINPQFVKIKEILHMNDKPKSEGYKNIGFAYSVNLFYCALLCYYDRFHNFSIKAIKKLLTWSMMIRIDMMQLGYETINDYALSDKEEGSKYNKAAYTNQIPMFYKICYARRHREIENMTIEFSKKENKNWEKLREKLMELNEEEDI